MAKFQLGDSVYVNTRGIAKDDDYGTKARVIGVSHHQVQVLLLTANRTTIVDELDCSGTRRF